MMIIRKIICLVLLILIFSSCGKVKNSSSADAASAGGSDEFVAAKQIIAEKCLSCHSSWTSYSEADYVSKRLVSKKSPNNSDLYTRIRGNDSGIAGDMPEGQPNLSQTDMSIIKKWISGIQ